MPGIVGSCRPGDSRPLSKPRHECVKPLPGHGVVRRTSEVGRTDEVAPKNRIGHLGRGGSIAAGQLHDRYQEPVGLGRRSVHRCRAQSGGHGGAVGFIRRFEPELPNRERGEESATSTRTRQPRRPRRLAQPPQSPRPSDARRARTSRACHPAAQRPPERAPIGLTARDASENSQLPNGIARRASQAYAPVPGLNVGPVVGEDREVGAEEIDRPLIAAHQFRRSTDRNRCPPGGPITRPGPRRAGRRRRSSRRPETRLSLRWRRLRVRARGRRRAGGSGATRRCGVRGPYRHHPSSTGRVPRGRMKRVLAVVPRSSSRAAPFRGAPHRDRGAPNESSGESGRWREPRAHEAAYFMGSIPTEEAVNPHPVWRFTLTAGPLGPGSRLTGGGSHSTILPRAERHDRSTGPRTGRPIHARCSLLACRLTSLRRNVSATRLLALDRPAGGDRDAWPARRQAALLVG